jgi:hypothetical protein
MVRQWLSTDVPQADPRSGVVTAGLQDDSCGCPPPAPGVQSPVVEPVNDPYPTLTVRLRARVGFDGEGTPIFDWKTLVEGPAVVWAERSEFDDEAGFTEEVASAVIGYAGQTEVPETASVLSDDGRRWRVTSVGQTAGLLTMEMVRILDDAR